MVDKGVGVGDDLGEEGMQCSEHPYRSNPGGICAFCLQEKLGKLVSSSKSSPFFQIPPPRSSSSSSPSFRSDAGGIRLPNGIGGATSVAGGGGGTKISFLSVHHKKNKSSSTSSSSNYNYNYNSSISSSRKVMNSTTTTTTTTTSTLEGNNVAFKRSKSVAQRSVRRTREGGIIDSMDSPRKKSFWSFLYLSSSSSSNNSSSSTGGNKRRTFSSSSGEGDGRGRDLKHQHQQTSNPLAEISCSIADKAKDEAKTPKRPQAEVGASTGEEVVVENLDGSQVSSSSLGRKVARSRSVGCGSRSFSGDFLERISTGFGDCTLRRVESQREAKPKIILHTAVTNEEEDNNYDDDQQQQRIKERVKCGGIFGGFGIISSSSSSSSSYWFSADDFGNSGRISSTTAAVAAAGGGGGTPHSRSRSWGWAFASPMRAFRPSTSKHYSIPVDGSTANVIARISSTASSSSATTKNKVGATPSLLAVRS